MPFETIIYQKRDHAVWLTLNRPQAGNALNLKLAHEIDEARQAITDDDDVWSVVLTGSGEAFCTGSEAGDLALWKGLGWDELQRVNPACLSARALAGIDKPVIAVVNGSALGPGLELALCCDLRICSETATFGFPETSFGVIPSGGGSQRLPRIVGKPKAMEMILTADPIGAAEAHRCGLVSKVVPVSRLVAEAEEIVKKIVSRAPIAERYGKESVNKGMDMTLEQGLGLEGDLSFLLQTTADRDEGIKAFLEKRTPHFKGN